MRIGTPLSPSATKILLLGSGELGKEVIVALQRLGGETVAVDRYANAPGHQVAHRAHVIAMTDAAALTRLIEQERPHIVGPEIEAIATDALVSLEAAGVTQVIPTARAAKLTMNREGIRRLAAQTRFPTFIEAGEELERCLYSQKGGMSDAEFEKHIADVERYAEQHAKASVYIPSGDAPKTEDDLGSPEKYAMSQKINQRAVKIATDYASKNPGKVMLYDEAKRLAREELSK